MRRTLSFCAILLLAGVARAADAPAPPVDEPVAPTEVAAAPDYTIHLITMGQGDHLYTGGGHAAIMVARMQDGEPVETVVYNYGDADWDADTFVSDFMRGEIDFFLSRVGDLNDTVMDYGVRQARNVWRQELRLPPQTAREIAEHLAWQVKPENRNYRFHHTEAICTTKIRDLLDQKLDGAISRQLGPKVSPSTVRDTQEWAYNGHWLASAAGLVLFGRKHDEPMSEYYATFLPPTMRESFQRVMVPEPSGGAGEVALAGEPVLLVERQGGPPHRGPNLFPYVAAVAFLLLLILLGVRALVRLPDRPRLAGLWLLLWATVSGAIGAAIAFLMAFSTVPELTINELIVVLPPTDLLLLVPAIQWLRGKRFVGPWLRGYVAVRLVTTVLMLLARVPGLLIQPWVVYLVAVVGAFYLYRFVASLHAYSGTGVPITNDLAVGLAHFLRRLFGWKAVGELPEGERHLILIAAPHTSNWDGFFLLVLAGCLRVKLSWMVKKDIFVPPLSWLLRWFSGIPIDRSAPQGVVQQMVDELNSAEAMLLAVPPTGTRGKLDHWKSGFLHIARKADLPIALGFLDFARRTGGVGPILRPSGDLEKDMDVIREFYAGISPKHEERRSAVRLREEGEPPAPDGD